MNLVNDDSFGHVTQKLGGVEFVVGSWGLDDLGLFLDSKVFVRVGGVDVLCVQIQDFIVGNNARVGKVVYAGQTSLGHGLE